MADEMLFTVAGSVAMPAQMISLEEAGLAERADLQEWVLANPIILGDAVKVITFDLDGLPATTARDRVHVLGLGADGRLVVAEIKSGRTPDTEVLALKYAALASRLLPESLAEYYVRLQGRLQQPLSAEEALAELQAHAPDMTQELLRRPRIVLLAHDFSPVITASVVWLSEMGLDLSLMQVSAFRSYVYSQAGTSDVPMISVSKLYPVREVEEFTISPERQLAKEVAAGKRRVQDASTARRLVASETVADGTMLTFSPRNELRPDMRDELEAWLHEDPTRRTAYWQNNMTAPLVWDADKVAYTPAALVRHMVEQATGVGQDFFGTQWWRDPNGWTIAELAGPLGGGKGALYRDFWSRWLEKVRQRHAHWTRMSTLPAQNFITLPSPIRGTHYGLSFASGGRLRSDFSIDLGSPEESGAQFEAIYSQRDLVESLYGVPLSWERLPDRSAFRIADYGEGEITRTEDYPFYIDWMIDAQERMHRAIGEVAHGGRPPAAEDFDRR